jgi:hypothetical protein
LTFDAIDSWWWPFLFIIVAGWLATDMWRFLGVYLGGRVSSDSEILVLVRAVATALVAGVISSLIVAPSGPLAATPLLLRIAAAAAGFAAYILTGHRILVGIFVGEAILVAGMLLL